MIDRFDWLKIHDSQVESRLGDIHHALFDFDGTLSVMREGWENVMQPVMEESICGSTPITPEIENEVREYIDRSTGILTIKQMEWLAEAVLRHGLVGKPLTAGEYKAIYLQRLMVSVKQRIARVRNGTVPREEMMMAGAGQFVRGLVARGITLYLASGTDHADVVNEAQTLGVAEFFNGGIYGALDASEANGKERIIQRILDEHQLSGNELIVVGDGPVEIREAKSRGALSLGVATDEIHRCGWNEHKVQRLTHAGVDLLIPDFSHSDALLGLLFQARS